MSYLPQTIKEMLDDTSAYNISAIKIACLACYNAKCFKGVNKEFLKGAMEEAIENALCQPLPKNINFAGENIDFDSVQVYLNSDFAYRCLHSCRRVMQIAQASKENEGLEK